MKEYGGIQFQIVTLATQEQTQGSAEPSPEPRPA